MPVCPQRAAISGSLRWPLNMQPRRMGCATGSRNVRGCVSLRLISRPRVNSRRSRRPNELWIANYPRDLVPRGNLGTIYVSIGKYEKALAEYQEELQNAPDDVGGYDNLAATYLALNRLDEAKATFDQALKHKLDDGSLRGTMYWLTFLRVDSAQMEQELAWGAGKPGDEDQLLSAQSDTEAYYGRMSKARDFSRRAVDSAIRSDSKETAALWQANAALRGA